MSEPLTIDQAVSTLVGEPEPQDDAVEALEAPAEAAEEPTEEIASDTQEEDPDGEAEEPGDDGEEKPEEEAEAVAPVDPPVWWKAEAKARFAELPPELQAVVFEQEQVREKVVSEAKAQAAQTVQAAQKEMEGVQTLAAQLAEFLPQALETFDSRWGKQPDWAAVVQERGAEEAFVLKSQWEAEQQQLRQLSQANDQAKAQAHHAYVKAEFVRLAEIAPELAPDVSDPTKGAEARVEVTQYLEGLGIPRDAIVQISATEMLIARKAQLWDKAQAQPKALATKIKPAAPAKSPVRPAASVPAATPQRIGAQAANRFAQTRSVDDAVAMLLARK